ncbi:DUF983 domain-containing protein [Flavobacterium faecale]|uniref:DUF983 domain-containing protein n=1 Tax=Flavobacterium faecale TaxID=1355330 RepID=A0A2S1L942_9FLAO|nr:DUF983 domain-containing protein [Flavobacterium faecale]AWG20269.1 DUF983 domain-containing protein [Flavobacterium faecale]
MAHTLINILNNTCPHCHEGKVFDEKSPFLNFGFPKMHKSCSHCHNKYEKEPGYFFGAMYMNYGITVAESIATFVIAQQFFTERFDLRIIPIIAFVIIFFASFNIRLSRMLWLYMFKNYSM